MILYYELTFFGCFNFRVFYNIFTINFNFLSMKYNRKIRSENNIFAH